MNNRNGVKPLTFLVTCILVLGTISSAWASSDFRSATIPAQTSPTAAVAMLPYPALVAATAAAVAATAKAVAAVTEATPELEIAAEVVVAITASPQSGVARLTPDEMSKIAHSEFD